MSMMPDSRPFYKEANAIDGTLLKAVRKIPDLRDFRGTHLIAGEGGDVWKYANRTYPINDFWRQRVLLRGHRTDTGDIVWTEVVEVLRNRRSPQANAMLNYMTLSPDNTITSNLVDREAFQHSIELLRAFSRSTRRRRYFSVINI